MGKKTKPPKRLAGVKIPKPLRSGLRDLARSQDGKTVLTEALLAAAGVLAVRETRPGSRTRKVIAEQAPRAKAKAKELAGEARSWAASAGAFAAATRAFTDSLRQGFAPGPATSDLLTPPRASQ